MNRSSFLAALGAVSATGSRGFAPRARRLPSIGIALTLVDATGRHLSHDVFFAVIGVNASGQWEHLRRDGTFELCRQRDNGPNGYANYSLHLGRSRELKVSLPQVPGGARLYVSIGRPLGFAVNDQNIPGSPNGWTPGDPNYGILFDWLEFTYNENGWGGNTTMVDMFGIPLDITLAGSSGIQRVGVNPGARTSILDTLAKNSAFAPLIVTVAGAALRAISPFHGIDNGVFDSDYFDSYIAAVWKRYRSHTLTMTTAGYGTYEGAVGSSGTLVFAQSGQRSISFNLPATRDVFACAGALAPENCGQSGSQQCYVQGQIAAALGAAFNRTTLLVGDDIPYCRLGHFYQNSTTNFYSAVMHGYSRRGLAYGFPFDDNCNEFSSFIIDENPTGVTVTISRF